jgi:hypothetical protein
MVVIDDLKKKIEREYVGFSPSTASIKPAHIANGMFRTILGHTVSTKVLNRFVISQTQKGVKKGHELDTVYQILLNNKQIDEQEIRKEDIKPLRPLLKKIVGADSAVFTDGMESYTAGFSGFATKDRIGQDGGELVAEWLRSSNSDLYEVLKKSLKDSSDTISTLCIPLLDDSNVTAFTPPYNRIPFLKNSRKKTYKQLWDGMFLAANTLSKHLHRHPNKLLRLRFAVLFSCFVIVRHLTSLEARFVKGTGKFIPPFLLAFDYRSSNGSVARASLQTYARACQSVARFYAWAFSEQLLNLIEEKELSDSEPPIYSRKPKKALESKKNIKEQLEAAEIWSLAVKRAEESDDDGSIVFGEAIYDMMATQQEGDPIKYLRKLALLSGLTYPPNQTPQRFVPKQDMLEVLILGLIEPGESIDMLTLQERLYDRYRIIIGGRQEDEKILMENGIYQVDSNAMQQNREMFSAHLGRLDFARLLADGVLQIEVEVTS